MSAKKIKIIIDYDGTLTYEERYVADLAKSALKDLSQNILHVPLKKITKLYNKTRNKILKNPHKYSWIVNGLPACYATEGALLLNTVTTQTLIKENKNFVKKAEQFLPNADYGPVVGLTNYLFHKHTHNLQTHFRENADKVLKHFIKSNYFQPYILTCSKGDKVAKNLAKIKIGAHKYEKYSNGLKDKVHIFGDTRQYEMNPSWEYCFNHPRFGKTQKINIDEKYSIELRRSDYFNKLKWIGKDGSKIIITADMVSLPGILPLLMGMDFVMIKASHVPQWSIDFVRSFKNGYIIENIDELPAKVDQIMENWFLKNKL